MLDFPDMSDEEWEGSTPEKQDAYNHKIKLRNTYKAAMLEYETTMSMAAPFTLMIIGAVLIVIYWMLSALVIGIGIIWLFIRVISRSHAYQRYKDTEAAFKEVL